LHGSGGEVKVEVGGSETLEEDTDEETLSSEIAAEWDETSDVLCLEGIIDNVQEMEGHHWTIRVSREVDLLVPGGFVGSHDNLLGILDEGKAINHVVTWVDSPIPAGSSECGSPSTERVTLVCKE